MAELCALKLTANGTVIEGEPTQTSLDREGCIELFKLELGVKTNREKGSGMATGRRVWEALTCWSRIDKSTPLIVQALCRNEKIDAEVRMFRPAPSGDGTTEHFYTLNATQGRISHVRQFSPDSLDPVSTHSPPCVEFGIVFRALTISHVPGAIEAHDDWTEGQS